MNPFETYEDRIKYCYDDDPYKEPPDIYDLFGYYNQRFFKGRLCASILRWSKKMTLCAGTCAYQGTGSCTITLSEPLLKYRSNNELKETLLHEMIHAYLFLTDPMSCRINEGHGPAFLDHMYDINKQTGLNVTVYHQFHDEVDRCRQHVWKCDGPCQAKPPFFGIVKRSMNRPPQKADNWFEKHEKECGGKFVKIQGPDKFNNQEKKQSAKPRKKKQESLPEFNLDAFLTRQQDEGEFPQGRKNIRFEIYAGFAKEQMILNLSLNY